MTGRAARELGILAPGVEHVADDQIEALAVLRHRSRDLEIAAGDAHADEQLRPGLGRELHALERPESAANDALEDSLLRARAQGGRLLEHGPRARCEDHPIARLRDQVLELVLRIVGDRALPAPM
jgi:hypothetical protein